MLPSPALKRRHLPLQCSLLLFALTLPLITAAAPAFATTKMVLLSPMRAIFTDRERTLPVNISNSSDEPATYTISLITMRADAKGQLREVQHETEQEQLAKSLIRFSPRRAVIEPRKRQVIKLMVQKPGNLPKGEYQTRLKFTPLASEKKAGAQSDQTTESSANFDIEILVASSIPIIIQHGVNAVVTPRTCQIKDAPKAPSGLAATVAFTRSGDASGFGNARLVLIPTKAPTALREIGKVQGLAIYLPHTEHTVDVPLTGISRKELAAGTVRVEFQHDTSAGAGKRTKEGAKTFKDFAAL